MSLTEQFKCGVPENERRPGWLYDADSGVLMGLASDEMKAKHAAGVPFTFTCGGCPHKVVIHPVPIKVGP